MESRPHHFRSRLSATIALPAMTTEQASLLFEVLGEIAAAIWDAYEPEISSLAAEEARLALYEPDEDDLVVTGDPDADPSIPF
jgi:hypothetical protein